MRTTPSQKSPSEIFEGMHEDIPDLVHDAFHVDAGIHLQDRHLADIFQQYIFDCR